MKKQKFIMPLVLALLMVFTSVLPVLAKSTTDKIQWLVDRNYVEGYEDGSLRLDNTITRAEFAKMIAKVNGDEALARNLKDNPSIFKDVPRSHWANGYINRAVQKGYLKGYEDGTFRPENTISNEEVIAVLARLHPDFKEVPTRGMNWSKPYVDFARSHDILRDLDLTGALRANATRRITFEMIYNYEAEMTARNERLVAEAKRKLAAEKYDPDYWWYYPYWDGYYYDRYYYDGRYYDYRVRFYDTEDHLYRTRYFDYGDYLRLPVEPTREGYKFDGWYNKDFTKEYTENFRFNGYHFDPYYDYRDSDWDYYYRHGYHRYYYYGYWDLDLYAKWKPIEDEKPETYKVTFKFDSPQAADTTFEIEKGDKVSEPDTPKKNGYDFVGWYTDEELTNKFDFNTAITKDLTLYAKWKENPNKPYVYILGVTVLDEKGEMISDAKLTVTDKDGNVKNPAQLENGTYTIIITKDGYEEAKQEVTIQDANKEVTIKLKPISNETDTHKLTVKVLDENNAETTATVTVTKDGLEVSDLTKLANGTYTVTVTKDGYKSVTKNVTIADKDETLEIKLEKDETTTYTVTFDLTTGTGTMNPVKVPVVKNGKTTYTLPPNKFGEPNDMHFSGWNVNGEEKQPNEEITLTGNITIKAIWATGPANPTDYKISFQANGGLGTMETEIVKVATEGKTKYKLPENKFGPPAGKKFKAWSLLGEEKAPGTEITLTDNIVLVALWEDEVTKPQTSYTVTFDLNGGTGTFATTQTVKSGDKVQAPSANPTRAGYIFKGWFLEDGTTKYFFTEAVTGDITLMAKWEKTYVVFITSDVNGKVTLDETTPWVKGDTVTLTITPNDGYELDKLTVTDGSNYFKISGEGEKRTFTMPESDVTVTATFKEKAETGGEVPGTETPDQP